MPYFIFLRSLHPEKSYHIIVTQFPVAVFPARHKVLSMVLNDGHIDHFVSGRMIQAVLKTEIAFLERDAPTAKFCVLPFFLCRFN